MGKRKSSKVAAKPAAPKLDEIFDCPFCNHNQTVEVKFSRGNATISCRICTASFEMVTSNLTKPIDVYSEWIDECERQNS
jgi:transcription elongation factor Elf1